nr:choice-of-anchor L domain-containing protein [Symbiobacterium terraclitae]
MPFRKAISWLVAASMMAGMSLSAAPTMADELDRGEIPPYEGGLNEDEAGLLDPLTGEGELAEVDLATPVPEGDAEAEFSVLNIVVPGSATKEQLAMAIVGPLIDHDPGRLADVEYEGSKKAASSGTFTGGGGIINIEQGAVLTTGKAVDVGAAPNKTWSFDSGSGADPLLSLMLLQHTTNRSVLEFRFRPVRSGTISFNYVFGSDEFEVKNPGNRRNDGFYFLFDEWLKLDAVDNIATLPGDKTVSVYNLQNSGLLINNPPGPDEKKIAVNGFSQVLTTKEVQVQKDKWYNIRIGIADAWDAEYDSAVFIGPGSYKDTEGPKWPKGAALDVVEQCGIVTLTWPEANDSSPPVEYAVQVNGAEQGRTQERTFTLSLAPGAYRFAVVPSDAQGNQGSALSKDHTVTFTPGSGGGISWLTPAAVANGESFHIQFMHGGCAGGEFDKTVAVKVRDTNDNNKLLAGFVYNQSITFDEATKVYSQLFDTSRFNVKDTVIRIFVYFGNKLRGTWDVIVGAE